MFIDTDRNIITEKENKRKGYKKCICNYDVAVVQWITSCHTCNNTLASTRNVIDNVRVNNAFSC